MARPLATVLVLLSTLAGATAAPASGEPDRGRAVFDRMIRVMREARTLTYRSRYATVISGRETVLSTYRVWLRRDNRFRLEARPYASVGAASGVIVGDGTSLWIHWPKGRPKFSRENRDDWAGSREKVYYREDASRGHSIGHRTGWLGASLGMPIVDPSTFHGPYDGMLSNIDGFRLVGEETVADEPCDAVELSILRGQRIRTYWLARRDGLPRKVRQEVRLARTIVIAESWSDVRLDEPMDDSLFTWATPAGWRPWRPSTAEERLLRRGTTAPEFDLALGPDRRVRLVDLRGKIVWLVFWRAG